MSRRLNVTGAVLAFLGAILPTGAARAQDQAGGAEASSDQAAAPAAAEADNAADLAKKLSNPVASLISVPFQANFDGGIGPARNGQRFTLNIQPVIPIPLNADWNLISRTIVPVVSQSDIFPGQAISSG